MHKNQFWERNKNLGIPRGEMERMWRILQEKQMMEQMMQAASVAGSGSSSGSPAPPVGEILYLTLDNISNASLLVDDPSSVGDWNTWFGLPGALGQAFTSVELDGNSVLLKGGSGIKIKPDLTYGSPGRDNITSVDDTGCVIGVGGGAFADCAVITSLSLPACLEIYGSSDSSYGKGAFEGSNLYTAPSLPLVTTVGSRAFYGSNITSIELFNALTTIGDSAFEECTSLDLAVSGVPLVTTVGSSAFKNCTGITYGNFSILTSLGSQAFMGCTNMAFFYAPLITAGNEAFRDCTSMTIVSLPSLLSAGNGTFRNTGIISVDFPILTSLGDQAFMGCTGMTTFTAPGLLSAGAAAFKNCSSLQSVSFPLLAIAENELFFECTLLSSATLSSVVTLGNACFYNSGLSGTHTFNATTVGDTCFAFCANLQQIYLPQAESIRFQAFRNCFSLEVISIPVCSDLGGSVGNNQVFGGIVNPLYDEFGTPYEVNRELTVPESLMTCNGGAPDGDIQYLQNNNGGYLTIVEIK